ncbi:MAG: hypothetical protein AAF740_09115 [Bacteroidota bacterium]
MDNTSHFRTAWDLHEYIIKQSDPKKILMRSEEDLSSALSDAFFGKELAPQQLRERLKEDEITPLKYQREFVDI